VAHPQNPLAGFAHDGERLDKQVVDGFAIGQPGTEFSRFCGQLLVGESGGRGFECVDALGVRRRRITSRSLPSKSVLRKAIQVYNRSAGRPVPLRA